MHCDILGGRGIYNQPGSAQRSLKTGISRAGAEVSDIPCLRLLRKIAVYFFSAQQPDKTGCIIFNDQPQPVIANPDPE
jgi:hypothetical protein